MIGRELLSLLTDRKVYAVARQAPGETQDVTWIDHDLRSGAPELPADVGTVVHLAQSPRFRDFPRGAADVFSVNVASTAALLEAAVALGGHRFVLASTGAVYRTSDGPIGEDAPLQDPPSSFYAATKRAAEVLARGYEGRLETTIARFFFVYGSRQRSDMLLPRLKRMIMDGEPIHLQGTDGIRLNPIHASDAAAAIAASLALTGDHVINVAGTEVVSLRQLAVAIGEALQIEPTFEITSDATEGNLVAETHRMQQLLGTPKMTIAQGAKELCI